MLIGVFAVIKYYSTFVTTFVLGIMNAKPGGMLVDRLRSSGGTDLDMRFSYECPFQAMLACENGDSRFKNVWPLEKNVWKFSYVYFLFDIQIISYVGPSHAKAIRTNSEAMKPEATYIKARTQTSHQPPKYSSK